MVKVTKEMMKHKNVRRHVQRLQREYRLLIKIERAIKQSAKNDREWVKDPLADPFYANWVKEYQARVKRYNFLIRKMIWI